MNRVFKKLENLTLPTPGEEIGAAVSAVMEDVARSNQALAQMVAEAISTALASKPTPMVQEAPVVHIPPQPEPIREWVFDVKRDARGYMTRIVATASN